MTIYNNSYEIEITPQETRETHYIRGSNGVIGAFIKNDKGQSRTEYWHKDNLGSLNIITDEQGKIVKEFSFDAWGKRRNLDWSMLKEQTKISESSYERGFTTHEHYDLFDLVDMNGRIYDPVLGRFLSPDPFIQDISDLQNFNRYSYVLNNPLTYTDPSGYFSIGPIKLPNPFESLRDAARYLGGAIPLVGIIASSDWAWEKGSKWIKENWKTVVIITVSVAAVYLTGGLAAGFLGAVISGAVGGFAGSFTGTLLNGGTLGDAFKAGGKGAAIGAATAGLTYGVGSAAQSLGTAGTQITATGYGVKIIGHGLVQGGATKVQGGKFSHGFYSGAITGGFEPVNASINSEVGRVASSAVLGGTTSEINGGKFANGAVTGAYVYLFNSRLHPGPDQGNSTFGDDMRENMSDIKTGLGYVNKGLKFAAEGNTSIYGEFLLEDAKMFGQAAAYIGAATIAYDISQKNYIDAAKAVTIIGAAAVVSVVGLPVVETAVATFLVVECVSQGYNAYKNLVKTINNIDNLPRK